MPIETMRELMNAFYTFYNNGVIFGESQEAELEPKMLEFIENEIGVSEDFWEDDDDEDCTFYDAVTSNFGFLDYIDQYVKDEEQQVKILNHLKYLIFELRN